MVEISDYLCVCVCVCVCVCSMKISNLLPLLYYLGLLSSSSVLGAVSSFSSFSLPPSLSHTYTHIHTHAHTQGQCVR